MPAPMINIQEAYSLFCAERNIPFSLDDRLRSYDDTTLFCPAGMQQFKPLFKDKSINGLTKANVQSCLRLLDMDQLGDGTHFLHFHMMGLFSFRGMTVQEAVDFWLAFLSSVGISPDYFTIHPDKPEWAALYPGKEVRQDEGCIWSDGELSGYCTEFYKDDIEIGNIVNIYGDCIDVGFGLERLEMVINGSHPDYRPLSENDLLAGTITKLLSEGIIPGNKMHGYVLRRLMRLLHNKGGRLANEHFLREQERQEGLFKKYARLKDKHQDKSAAWWFDTHGIDLSLMSAKQ